MKEGPQSGHSTAFCSQKSSAHIQAIVGEKVGYEGSESDPGMPSLSQLCSCCVAWANYLTSLCLCLPTC